MSYADKRNGKDTGSFVGEAPKLGKKRRFKLKRDADDYEAFCKMFGREPPTIENAANPTGAPTFAEVAERCKKAGGPHGKWKLERDHSLAQRLQYCIDKLGTYEIQRVTRTVLRERILDTLDKRPKAPGQRRYEGLLSNATKNRYLSVAHAVLTYAHNEEILVEHPPKAPFLDEEETVVKRDILQVDQDEVVLRLMREAGDELEAMCVDVLIQTGLRRGELCGKLQPDQITIEQVEDEEGTLVPVGVIRLHKGQTKNNTARMMMLSAELAKQIRALIAAGKLPTGARVLTCFKRAVKRAGYTGNVVVHSLRHARVTRLRKAGIDRKMRKELLGHMDDDVHDGYDHSDLEDHLEVVKKVEEYAGKRREKAAKRTAQVLDFAQGSK